MSRSAQKHRTREAILAGARAMAARGEPVTVAAAAAEQGISRATAYRYFSDPVLLVAEAGLAIEVRDYETVVGTAAGVPERLLAITLYVFDLACEHEAGFRQFLARNLDVSLTVGRPERSLRGARRVAMLERALDEGDVSLSAPRRAGLVRALSAITGIEAVIALEDVAGASRAEARETVEELATLVIERHLSAR